LTQKPRLGRKIAAILIVALLFAGVIFMNGLTYTNVRGNWWGIVGVFLFSCALFLVPNDSTDVDRARWSNHNITDRGVMAWRRFQEERRKKAGIEPKSSEQWSEPTRRSEVIRGKKKRRRMVR